MRLLHRLSTEVRSVATRGRASGHVLAYAASLLWRHARLPSSLLVAQSLVAGVTAPLIVWAIGGLVDTLTHVPPDPWPAVRPWLAALFVALVIRGVEGATARYLTMINRERLRMALYRRLFELAISLPLDSFERPEYYQRLENSRRALITGGGLANVLEILMRLVSRVIGAAGLLLLFANAHWLLAVLLLAATILRSVVAIVQVKQFVDVSYHRWASRREMGYWSGLLSSREAAPELRLFGLGEPLLARWRRVFDDYLAAVTAARWRMALHSLASGVFQELVGWTTLLVLLLLALQGTIGLGSLVALLYGLSRFRQLINDIA